MKKSILSHNTRLILALSFLTLVMSACAGSNREVKTTQTTEPVVVRHFQGVSSFVGAELQGRKTANGERFNRHALTAAHRTIKLGTWIRVTNPETSKTVVLKVNDRGPFIKGRVLDVTEEAARRLGFWHQGTAVVDVDVLDSQPVASYTPERKKKCHCHKQK